MYIQVFSLFFFDRRYEFRINFGGGDGFLDLLLSNRAISDKALGAIAMKVGCTRSNADDAYQTETPVSF